MHFFTHFRQLCALKGMSPNAVARQLHISSGSITNWKNGTVPKSDRLQKIADYFGVSVDFLLEGEESSTEDPIEMEIHFRGGDVLDKGDLAQLKAVIRSTIDTYISEAKKKNGDRGSRL